MLHIHSHYTPTPHTHPSNGSYLEVLRKIKSKILCLKKISILSIWRKNKKILVVFFFVVVVCLFVFKENFLEFQSEPFRSWG